MRSFSLLLCLVTVSLTACSTEGTYDTYGQSAAPRTILETPRTYSAKMHDNYYHRHADYAVRPQDNAYIYDRPGYYDYNGYYLSQNNSLNVPRNMFPPHGMCRIWFPDRGREEQASLESCEGIQHRVPVGAYVVYGG